MAQNFSIVVNQTAHGFSDGDALAFNGTYFKAQGDSIADADNFVGFVTQVTTVNQFTLDFGGLISYPGTLVSGDRYYLDAVTAGAITNVAPGGSNVVKPVLLATSPHAGYILYSALDSVAGNFLLKANNLSDVASVPDSILNLFPGYILKDSGDFDSLNWDAHQTFDAAGVKSLDYDLRAGYLSDGTTLTLNWGVAQLNDIAGPSLLSIDWGARQQYANDGTTVMIDWSNNNNLYLGPTGHARFVVQGDGLGAALILVDSTDPNAGFTFQTNGSGGYDFTSGTTTLLLLTNQAGAVNNFQMDASLTGVSPILSVQGADADIDFELAAKGAGVIFSNNPISAFGGLILSEAANGRSGVATLVAGIVTVSNTSVTANTRFEITPQDGNTVGVVRPTSRSIGVSFTLTSTLNTDTGVVYYQMYEPA